MFSTATLFQESEFDKFSRAVMFYCDENKYHGLHLTQNELKQLQCFMGIKTITPEARGNDLTDQLHFEIKRSLARCYSFELLLRGDARAYDEFAQAQKEKHKLLFSEFTQLSHEARNLDTDALALVRASCFLSINDSLIGALNERGITYSKDSEEFLSQFAEGISKDANLAALCPATAALTDAQRLLARKMYWPNMHFRHMMYTEGGDGMTKTFSDGVSQGEFSREDFQLWKWRWLTNIFGFQSGPAAKCYTTETHLLASTIIAELEQVFVEHHYPYLENYLVTRAKLAGTSSYTTCLRESEIQLIGHLVAYFNQVNIVTCSKGDRVLAAYGEFKHEFDDAADQLAELYASHRRDSATITPTYVPAVLNSAYAIFKNKFHMNKDESIQNATKFMCQVLSALYSCPHDVRISCMNFAKEANLLGVLEAWRSNHLAFDFSLNASSELVAEESVRATNRLGD